MTDATPSETPSRRILDAGSGGTDLKRLPPYFSDEAWEIVTVDVDPQVNPDHVGSLTDMRTLFPDRSFDVIWSSHSVEHLYSFELRAALGEFRRVLKPDGFALITCPDVEAVATALLEHGLDHVAYVAPAGPITLHDILYGHTASIEGGATAMAHRTGLTAERLGKLALEAGFLEAVVGTGSHYDLWAVLQMPDTDLDRVKTTLLHSDAGFLFTRPEIAGTVVVEH